MKKKYLDIVTNMWCIRLMNENFSIDLNKYINNKDMQFSAKNMSAKVVKVAQSEREKDV